MQNIRCFYFYGRYICKYFCSSASYDNEICALDNPDIQVPDKYRKRVHSTSTRFLQAAEVKECFLAYFQQLNRIY